jgi:hypothetical protein
VKLLRSSFVAFGWGEGVRRGKMGLQFFVWLERLSGRGEKDAGDFEAKGRCRRVFSSGTPDKILCCFLYFVNVRFI